MDSTVETVALEREIAIAASPETVWEFLVDPEKAARWMGMNVTLDPRPGGAWRNEIVPGHTASGEFVELDRPRRLVFTWGWEPDENGAARPVPPGSSTIVIELVPDGDGTRVHFTHRDLPGEESARSHAHGWDHYLPRLSTAAAGGDAGRDPWIDGDM